MPQEKSPVFYSLVLTDYLSCASESALIISIGINLINLLMSCNSHRKIMISAATF
ncbi:MAG: hypothetical protein OFPI_19060 [Osedax symbiont Rs2]|nr:MAG: hypothetical protein OFPI_19060 [Osedax symbiont Rs2]